MPVFPVFLVARQATDIYGTIETCGRVLMKLRNAEDQLQDVKSALKSGLDRQQSMLCAFAFRECSQVVTASQKAFERCLDDGANCVAIMEPVLYGLDRAFTLLEEEDTPLSDYAAGHLSDVKSLCDELRHINLQALVFRSGVPAESLLDGNNENLGRWITLQHKLERTAARKKQVTLKMQVYSQSKLKTTVDKFEPRRMVVEYQLGNGEEVKWTSDYGHSAEYTLPRSARRITFWFGALLGHEPLYDTETDLKSHGRRCTNGAWKKSRSSFGPYAHPGDILEQLGVSDMLSETTVVAVVQGHAWYMYTCELYVADPLLIPRSFEATSSPLVTLHMKSVDFACLRYMKVSYDGDDGDFVSWESETGYCAELELPPCATNICFWFGVKLGAEPLRATAKDWEGPGRKTFNGAWLGERSRFGPFAHPGGILAYLSPASVNAGAGGCRVVALVQGPWPYGCYVCELHCGDG